MAGKKKISKTIRIEEDIVKRIEKLAQAETKRTKYSVDFSSITRKALIELLEREETK